MEDDASDIRAAFLEKTPIQRQIDIFKNIQEEAEDALNYENANNPSYLHAMSIVEDFLMKSGRICYGGQAINAHLPKKFKIYNPDYTLPDYDFFTPDPEADIDTLQEMLEKEGFIDIHRKEGIHEGTTKLYVLYTAVADITYLDPRIYKKLKEDELVQGGISYADVNFLRMMMHLEISRPRGQIQRWDKVFERLLLLNQAIPQYCKREKRGQIQYNPFRKIILDYIKFNQLIFAGADVFNIIKKVQNKNTSLENLIIRSKNPIIMYSPNIIKDSKALLERLREEGEADNLKSKRVPEVSDIVPGMKLIYYKNKVIAILVKDSACHSYIESQKLRIASIDTLVTLFLSFRYVRLPALAEDSILCLVNSMSNIQKKIRMGKHALFPAISIKCSGYQPSYPSLLRAKKARIKKKKGTQKKVASALV